MTLKLSIIKNTFKRKTSACIGATPSLFLENVAYNTSVQFIPVSCFGDSLEEHFQVRDLFIDAALTNCIHEWEKRGIPPIYAALHEGRYYHLMGEGQHRLNSAREAARRLKQDIGVPVWDISSYATVTPSRPRFLLVVDIGCFSTTGWNQAQLPPRKPEGHPSAMNDDDFCGFN